MFVEYVLKLKIARARGIPQLVAFVQHDNAPMLAVFRHGGSSVRPAPGASGVEAILSLVPFDAGRSRRGASARQARTALAWLHRAGRRVHRRLQTVALSVPPILPTP